MKDRIIQFLVNENISSAEFADRIGVQRSSVSHVLNERNHPSTSFIQKMLLTYRNINPRWLLLGEGTMLSSPTVVTNEPSLFSYPQSDDLLTAKSAASKVGIIENTVIPISKAIHEEQKDLPPNQNQLIQEVNEINGKTFDSKDIDRIVLFYKDKTFAVYASSE